MQEYEYLEKTVEEFKAEQEAFNQLSDELKGYISSVYEKINSSRFDVLLSYKDIDKIMIDINNDLYRHLKEGRAVDEDDIMNFHVNHQIELKKKNIFWR
jgi:hypothetical protein